MSHFIDPIIETWRAAVGAGRIEGGWGFVGAVYLLTWTGLIIYGVSLWVRRPRSQSFDKGSP